MDTAGRMQQADEGNVAGGTNCFYGGVCCLYQYVTSPMNVRYIYAVLFILATAFTWGVRENPQMLFRRQRFSTCEDDLDCLTVEAVLLASMTAFIFFFFMCVSTMYTSSVHDRRHIWHTQWWLPKMLLAASCVAISTEAPASLIAIYGRVARLGAGVFLFIQLIIIIRYITRFSSRWCQGNTANHYDHMDNLNVNTFTIIAYSASFIWLLSMLQYTDCYVNVVLISSTMCTVYLLMPLISIRPAAFGWYMEPGLMGLYIVYLCWSAVKSEPDSSCNKKGKGGPSQNWEIISFVVEIISIVGATFSTGTNYKRMQFKNVVGSENDVPYGYGYFHFVLALGSMYFGMLFLGWDTYHASKRWSLDVSWTSMWVHIANEVLAVIFFVAIVLARIYGTDSHRQFLGRMFGIGSQQHGEQSHAGETDTPQPPAHATETDTAQPPALLPPTTAEQQSPATETNSTERPTSSLPPTTTTELRIDLSSINDTSPAA